MKGRQCTSCGAHATEEHAIYCGFCGAELPLPEVPDPVDQAARFAALEVHPDAATIRARQPVRDRARTLTFEGLDGCIIGLFLPVLAAPVALGLFQLVAEPDRPGRVGPGHFIALLGVPALIVLAIVAFRVMPTIDAGTEPSAGDGWRAVRVLGVSTEEVGTGKYRTLVHHLTFADSAGARFRVDTPSRRVRDRLVPGDLGLAWIEGDTLVDYERVDV